MQDYFTADGLINQSAFKDWSNVYEFRDQELAFWRGWDVTGMSAGARQVVGRQQNAMQDLSSRIANLQNYGNHYTQAVGEIAAAFDSPQGALIGSGSAWIDRYEHVTESSSQSSAIFHVGFQRGTVSWAEAKEKEDLVGALWEVAPGLADTLRLSEALTAERNRSKETVTAIKAAAASAEKTRERNFALLVETAKETGKRWAVRRNLKMRSQIRAWREKHEASEVSIKSVEAAYKEHMGLRAPVEYWQTKAAAHGKSEKLLRWFVLAFFAIAIAVIVFAFWNVGWTLINLSLAKGATPLPPGVYVVASAGLGSAAAVLFWGGRLLTKLYLSQHHLRQDAEERATMTETYLALIENQAADAEDRQVILNALFRATPDGIVKEEGGLDPSIAAALGKYLAK